MPQEIHNNIGSDAVKKSTGKTWPEWFAFLDEAGAAKKTHQEIVAIVGAKFAVGPWWQQMVTVGYEQARGMRAKHQKAAGYAVGRSKTIPVPVATLFAAWKDARQRVKWLADSKFTIRTATANKSMRITWIDGETHVTVNFYDKGTNKSQVTVDHERLKNAKEAQKMKAYWGEQLEHLVVFLGS